MQTKLFVQTAFQQNCRIVSCPRTKKAICVDPGEPSPEVVEYINDGDLDLTAIVPTHGHLDHIGGVGFMHERFPNAQILLHRDEGPLYRSLPMQPRLMGIPEHQLQALGMDYQDPPAPTRHVENGDVLEVGDLRFELRHCPGHTPGHVVLVEHQAKTVFTGDCLFSGTIGRTDLPGGDHDQLIRSIRDNVLSLDDDFTVKCGHGPDTTVGEERIRNPFLNGIYRDAG
jgi:hydroxyacylglutathione hydrolase